VHSNVQSTPMCSASYLEEGMSWVRDRTSSARFLAKRSCSSMSISENEDRGVVLILPLSGVEEPDVDGVQGDEESGDCGAQVLEVEWCIRVLEDSQGTLYP